MYVGVASSVMEKARGNTPYLLDWLYTSCKNQGEK